MSNDPRTPKQQLLYLLEKICAEAHPLSGEANERVMRETVIRLAQEAQKIAKKLPDFRKN